MKRAWELIELAERVGARHKRKGYALNEASVQTMFCHAREELDELEESVDQNSPDIKELGDALSCLIHFAVRQGWTMEQVGEAMVMKLLLRLDFEGAQYEENKTNPEPS